MKNFFLTQVHIFFIFFIFSFSCAMPLSLAAAQEDSHPDIRFQKTLADLKKSADTLRKRNDFLRNQNKILRAKIAQLRLIDLLFIKENDKSPASYSDGSWRAVISKEKVNKNQTEDLEYSDEAVILRLNEQSQKLKAQNNILLDKIAQKEQEDSQAQSKLKDFNQRIAILKEKMAFTQNITDHPIFFSKEAEQLRNENLLLENKRNNGLMLFDQEIQQLKIQKEQLSGSLAFLQEQTQHNRLLRSQFSKEEKNMKTQIASWQRQERLLKEEVLKLMETMIKLDKQKNRLKEK